MIDWLAMTVAIVASTISGVSSGAGTEPVEDVAFGRRAREHDRRLAGVVEDEGRKDDKAPREADRPWAEMPHVGVKRLGAGHAEEDAAKHEKALHAAAHQIVEAVERIDRHKDRRMLQDAIDAERGDDEEPGQHDRPEGAADRRRAERLHREQREQDRRSPPAAHTGLKAGAICSTPSSAESTEIAGVIAPSP